MSCNCMALNNMDKWLKQKNEKLQITNPQLLELLPRQDTPGQRLKPDHPLGEPVVPLLLQAGQHAAAQEDLSQKKKTVKF